jgi:hypothetical protein
VRRQGALVTRFSRLSRPVRYALVAVASFAIGSATIVTAAESSPLGSLFYSPMVGGVATHPCNSTTPHHGGTTTTCYAVVDSQGQLAVSDAATHAALNKLNFDSTGNLKVSGSGTSTVSGTVNVGNFPATQPVSGTVNVGNFPSTQAVVSKDATSFTTYFQTYTTDQFGQIFLTGPLAAAGFNKASLEIIQFPGNVSGLTVGVFEGKISGSTLAQVIDSFPLGAATVHSYDLNGPEISLVLTGGPPNTAVNIQAWVYLH